MLWAERQRFDPAGHYHRPDVLALDRHADRAVSSAVVVGAGVFGASTARELDRRGWDVTLVEQYTPGNVRSGSGGDTRLLRFSHGDAGLVHALGAALARALARARGASRASGSSSRSGSRGSTTRRERLHRTRARRRCAASASPCERLTPEEARRLYPSLGGDDLRSVLFEPEAGVLNARAATRALAAPLRVETGRPTPADPPRGRRRRLGVRLVAAEALPRPRRAADLAARRLLLRRRRRMVGHARVLRVRRPLLRPRRARRARDEDRARPAAPSRSTPTSSSGFPTAGVEALAREYAARRFPALADAPLIGGRVCQYDLTPTRISSSRATPSEPAGGCSAAAPATASSTARRSPSTSPTASRAAASPSRSTRLGPREGHARAAQPSSVLELRSDDEGVPPARRPSPTFGLAATGPDGRRGSPFRPRAAMICPATGATTVAVQRSAPRLQLNRIGPCGVGTTPRAQRRSGGMRSGEVRAEAGRGRASRRARSSSAPAPRRSTSRGPTKGPARPGPSRRRRSSPTSSRGPVREHPAPLAPDQRRAPRRRSPTA